MGIVLPFWQFFSWISGNGLAINALIAEIVNSSISSFARLDVIVSAIVLIWFIIYEGTRIKMKKLWMPIIGTCSVGVSLGLPLFLFLQEIHLTKSEESGQKED